MSNVIGMWKRREAGWCLACNRWGMRRWVRPGFSVISRLGDGVFWYALMLGMILFDGWNGLQASAHMAATGVAALLLYRLMKRWTRRPRPCASDARILALVPPLDEFSFPSGHTLHAVAFTGVAVAWYPLLAWVLVPFCGLIAASRVVLGLHYPSDVLAATGIGMGLAWLSQWLVAVI